MDCIFCKVVAGEIPNHTIYEDKDYMAFLDIFPVATGHTVVIPKKHHRWVWDVPDVGGYFEVCRKIAKHFQSVTKEELVMTLTIGNEVPHAHIHLLPTLNNTEVKKLIAAIVSVRQPQIAGEVAEKVAKKLKMS